MFWKKPVTIKFNPELLEDIPRVLAKSDADAQAILLYSQAVSLKRIADSMNQIEFYMNEHLQIAQNQWRNN